MIGGITETRTNIKSVMLADGSKIAGKQALRLCLICR
jgi:hypothetical protein